MARLFTVVTDEEILTILMVGMRRSIRDEQCNVDAENEGSLTRIALENPFESP